MKTPVVMMAFITVAFVFFQYILTRDNLPNEPAAPNALLRVASGFERLLLTNRNGPIGKLRPGQSILVKFKDGTRRNFTIAGVEICDVIFDIGVNGETGRHPRPQYQEVAIVKTKESLGGDKGKIVDKFS